MTQTGTPEARSGRGAPNVGPFSEPVPVVPLPSHSVSDVPSQLLRQYLRVEPWMIGKLCELPVQPLSRSEPEGVTMKIREPGSPGASRGHTTVVLVVEVVGVVGPTVDVVVVVEVTVVV